MHKLLAISVVWRQWIDSVAFVYHYVGYALGALSRPRSHVQTLQRAAVHTARTRSPLVLRSPSYVLCWGGPTLWEGRRAWERGGDTHEGGRASRSASRHPFAIHASYATRVTRVAPYTRTSSLPRDGVRCLCYRVWEKKTCPFKNIAGDRQRRPEELYLNDSSTDERPRSRRNTDTMRLSTCDI